MTALSIAAVAAPVVLGAYAYFAYPAILWLCTRHRPPPNRPDAPDEWPTVSICLSAYNEEKTIARTLETLLELDYPPDRRQILVVSDASTDRTDEIVATFADRGVQLLRMPHRVGKTAAENAARHHLRGSIVVNTDSSVRLDRDALRNLVVWFQDPEVGLASGRDVSVGAGAAEPNAAEAGYVGYEMWVRRLETRLRGIIGASGCLYAVRRELQQIELPGHLSRDFAAALVAYERGYRAISVEDAICYVPRTGSLRREYRRKVRTMTRGLETLWYKRDLLRPDRYGVVAWMLLSHKLCRWLVPLTAPIAIAGLLAFASRGPWARLALLAPLAGLGCAAAGWYWPQSRRAPAWVAVPAYICLSTLAGIRSWWRALRGDRSPTWDPTPRRI